MVDRYISEREEFKRFGLIANTDKIYAHGYHRFFPLECMNFRNENFSMIEIGILGGHSLNLWKQYFPNAYIFGMDIGDVYNDERTLTIRGDQSNQEDVNRLVSIVNSLTKNPVYFINDDGSHMPEHQLFTFDILFRNVLAEGGVYIIEDIETSYWRNGNLYNIYNPRYGYGDKNSIIEKCKSLLDYINREYTNETDKSAIDKASDFLSKETRDQISSIRFTQNCIIFRKKEKYEYEYFDKPYRYADSSK